MKLDKAKEILKNECEVATRTGRLDLRGALVLGIVALEREQVWRQNDPGGTIHLLPSETEE